MTTITKPIRMNWLDAARIAAAFGIIGIHSSSDRMGKAFFDYEMQDRIFPVLMRTVSELASSEFFIFLALFLLAFKLEKRPVSYGSTMRLQANRLLVPFAFWTVFYAFFVLFKANSFGYLDPMIERIMSPSIWLDYFLLGSSQYHMHFIPTIFLILLFHPIFQLAIRQPLLGLLVIPFLAFNLSMSTWIWSNLSDKTTIEYLARTAKVLSYLGYGFAAYAVLGLWQRKFDEEVSKKILYFSLLVIAMMFLVKLTYAAESIQSGVYAPRLGLMYFTHTLLPIFLVLAFLGSQHFAWPEKMSDLSKYTFGIYLMHPIIIDLIDITMKDHEMQPYQYVIFKYVITLSVALSLSVLISRLSWVAWTIGLGPQPFTKAWKEKSKKKQKITPAEQIINTPSRL